MENGNAAGISIGSGIGWKARANTLNKAAARIKINNNPSLTKLHISTYIIFFLYFAVSLASMGVIHQRSILNTANVTQVSGNVTTNITISLDNVFTPKDTAPGIPSILVILAGLTQLSFHLWAVKNGANHPAMDALAFNRSWLSPGIIFFFMGTAVILQSLGFWELAIAFQSGATLLSAIVMYNCGVSRVQSWINGNGFNWSVFLGNDSPQEVLFSVNLYMWLLLLFILGIRNQDVYFTTNQDTIGAVVVAVTYIGGSIITYYFMLTPVYNVTTAILMFCMGVVCYGTYVFTSTWAFISAMVSVFLAFTSMLELINLPEKIYASKQYTA